MPSISSTFLRVMGVGSNDRGCWRSVVGAGSMLLAADGDLAAASSAAHAAMLEHEQLPMPFERARTQLVVGQLLRRQRRRDAATSTLREAYTAFARLGAELWMGRTRCRVGAHQRRAWRRDPAEPK